MDHKKSILYHRYYFYKTLPVYLILSDADRSKAKTLARKQSFMTVKDYIKSLLIGEYDFIDASNILTVKNKSPAYNKNNPQHILKSHYLESPKLERYKNNINDTKQLTL